MRLEDFNAKTQARIRAALLAEAGARVPDTIPERDQASALVGTNAGEAQGDVRITVRFVGYRVRPLDPDNFAGSVKDLLDGLRHANLIPGDEPWRIKLETEQAKVGKRSAERTEITILYPPMSPSC